MVWASYTAMHTTEICDSLPYAKDLQRTLSPIIIIKISNIFSYVVIETSNCYKTNYTRATERVFVKAIYSKSFPSNRHFALRPSNRHYALCKSTIKMFTPYLWCHFQNFTKRKHLKN